MKFNYSSNVKAWMRKDLFFDFLKRFNAYILKEPNYSCLLLLCNCLADGTSESIPSLYNVVVHFPPLCTTSIIQPCGDLIIACVKRKFTLHIYWSCYGNIDIAEDDIYNIDILTAMCWVTNSWKEVSNGIITNCWNHSFRIAPSASQVQTRRAACCCFCGAIWALPLYSYIFVTQSKW